MAIKRVIINVLGEKNFLALQARSFQFLLHTGILKRGKFAEEYQDVYFLDKIIHQGDWCLDIGAHLGYFTLELSRLVGPGGKIFAIEPMGLFHSTLQRLLRSKNKSNVTLYKVALGGSGEYVEMGIPQMGDAKKFAHARIKAGDANKHLDFVNSEKVKNESGDALFAQLPRLDYIKCDVEGYEYEVFHSMRRTLATHHPVLLCEFFDRAKLISFVEMLAPMGYRVFHLDNGLLYPSTVYGEGQIPPKNYYFIPPQQEQRMRLYLHA